MTIKINIIGGKCGCPFCEGQLIGTSRNVWKARKNKHGRPFGTHIKGSHRRGVHKVL